MSQYTYSIDYNDPDFTIDPKIEEEIFFTRKTYRTCTECDGEGRIEVYTDVYEQMASNPTSVVLSSRTDYTNCPKCTHTNSNINSSSNDDEDSIPF